MSVPSEICESFRLEIAEVAKPYGWKYLKSTHTLKKQVRDIVFEILLRSSWHNSSSSSRVDMGLYYVPSDIMYLVDHGMIALDENDQIIFPE